MVVDQHADTIDDRPKDDANGKNQANTTTNRMISEKKQVYMFYYWDIESFRDDIFHTYVQNSSQQM